MTNWKRNAMEDNERARKGRARVREAGRDQQGETKVPGPQLCKAPVASPSQAR